MMYKVIFGKKETEEILVFLYPFYFIWVTCKSSPPLLCLCHRKRNRLLSEPREHLTSAAKPNVGKRNLCRVCFFWLLDLEKVFFFYCRIYFFIREYDCDYRCIRYRNANQCKF